MALLSMNFESVLSSLHILFSVLQMSFTEAIDDWICMTSYLGALPSIASESRVSILSIIFWSLA